MLFFRLSDVRLSTLSYQHPACAVRSLIRCVPSSPPRLRRRLLGSAVGQFRLTSALRSGFDALFAQLRTATLAAVPSTRRCLASCSAGPAFQFFASMLNV